MHRPKVLLIVSRGGSCARIENPHLVGVAGARDADGSAEQTAGC